MPDTTPKLKIPYAIASDRVSSYPQTALESATIIENKLTQATNFLTGTKQTALSPGTPTTPTYVQAGTAVFSNGWGDVTFPTPFPNGVISVIAVPGAMDGDPSSFVVYGADKTKFTCAAKRGNDWSYNASRANWIAYGW